MIYVYDILLNFNENMIPFFEWEDEDDIKYVKKIPLIKVSSELLTNMFYKKIKLDKTFLSKIENKTVFYDALLKEEEKYLFLATDNKKVLGFLVEDTKITKLSELLIEEEEEILDLATSLSNYELIYEIAKKESPKQEYLTRKEQQIKEYLFQELTTLKKNEDYEKLNYYYFEYFGKIPASKEESYQELLSSINNITTKHQTLFQIMTLSYQNK